MKELKKIKEMSFKNIDSMSPLIKRVIIGINQDDDFMKDILIKIGVLYFECDEYNPHNNNYDLFVDYKNGIISNNVIALEYEKSTGQKQSFCFMSDIIDDPDMKYGTPVKKIVAYVGNDHAKKSITISRINNKIFLPFCNKKLSSHQISKGHRPYFDSNCGKYYIERGAYVDYASLRRLIFQVLVEQIILDGKEFSFIDNRLSPKGYFSFRIDGDAWNLTDSNANKTMDLEDTISHRFTWFLDVSGWSGRSRSVIERLRGRDIQLHCHWHTVFNNYYLNKYNAKKAIAWIEKELKTKPVGYAAPFGIFEESNIKALNDLGIKYFSDFEYNSDDLPSKENGYLQIPIHNSSIGVMEMSGFDVEEMFDELYYAAVNQINKDGIAILYEHPFVIEPYYKHFLNLFYRLENDGYEYINMTDYANLYIQNECSLYEDKRKDNYTVLNNSLITLKTKRDINKYFEKIGDDIFVSDGLFDKILESKNRDVIHKTEGIARFIKCYMKDLLNKKIG